MDTGRLWVDHFGHLGYQPKFYRVQDAIFTNSFNYGRHIWSIKKNIEIRVIASQSGRTSVLLSSTSVLAHVNRCALQWGSPKEIICSDSEAKGTLESWQSRGVSIHFIGERNPNGQPLVCLRQQAIRTLWNNNNI